MISQREMMDIIATEALEAGSPAPTGSAVGTVLGEAPFVCDGCGEWKLSGEMHMVSNGQRILCLDCGERESPNAPGSATPEVKP